jgi:hypothetical protein
LQSAEYSTFFYRFSKLPSFRAECSAVEKSNKQDILDRSLPKTVHLVIAKIVILIRARRYDEKEIT